MKGAWVALSYDLDTLTLQAFHDVNSLGKDRLSVLTRILQKSRCELASRYSSFPTFLGLLFPFLRFGNALPLFFPITACIVIYGVPVILSLDKTTITILLVFAYLVSLVLMQVVSPVDV